MDVKMYPIGSRVTIFLPSLNGGGAERVMVALANAFAARGYAVDLVLALADGPYRSQVSDAVRIVDLKLGRVIKSLFPLVRYLRRERPVALLTAMTHANVVAILARMMARASTRLVISERSTITIEAWGAQGLVARILYSLVPLLYTRADGIVAVSQAAAADLVKFAGLPDCDVKVVYNPFDLRLIQEKAAQPVQHPWFSQGQPPVVLACGRLVAQKDFPILIHAFVRLRQQTNARLLILGEGESRKSLESLVAECGLTGDDVQMPGFVANPFAYMARSALFVLSSRLEGLPGVLIEALACGVPVVSTRCPSGPEEILEGGRWGKLVPVGDVGALSTAMYEVLSTPREDLPDGRVRARDFEQERAVDAYLAAMGLPPSTDLRAVT